GADQLPESLHAELVLTGSHGDTDRSAQRGEVVDVLRLERLFEPEDTLLGEKRSERPRLVEAVPHRAVAHEIALGPHRAPHGAQDRAVEVVATTQAHLDPAKTSGDVAGRFFRQFSRLLPEQGAGIRRAPRLSTAEQGPQRPAQFLAPQVPAG